MGSPRPSVSQLWDTAMKKLFPRRVSQTRDQVCDTFVSLQSSNTSEHTDAFYMYSNSLEEQNQKCVASQLRSSDSTDVSYSSALMDPIERPTLPYTISSPNWNIFSESIKYLDGRPNEDAADWLHSVLSVFSKVYTVAKIVIIILLHYGVELEDMPDSLLSHVAHAEEVVITDSLVELIDAVEGLYYAIYSRLIMEIANVDLSSCFHLSLQRMASKDASALPEPSHLSRILCLCKEILELPTVCRDINSALVKQHQHEYVRHSVDRVGNIGFCLDDLLGYRRYILGVATNDSSAFRQKWSDADLMYEMPPEEILAILSEKYLAIASKMVFQDEPSTSELPFVNPEKVDPEIWEQELIKDHRQATLAKLEGKCLGEVRRDDDRRRLSDYMKEQKCICRSSCSCAWDCTLDPERRCPCAERLMRIMLAKRRKGPGSRHFGVRCSSLAKAIFQGVSCIRRDVDDYEIAVELDRALLLFTEEVQKQRVAAAKANGVKSLSDD
ncbi:hypothetical protein EYZ11_011276 [Aspergillus tanneri]|uniref:Uncharacterized protein n=1 Tax=Aspergillus tanneri TaxID=1220188 RepID=A0A4S3J3V3_9EURO|nr:uncharacterized protein ATNIH1004_010360 [Aspergillus tanneri]KAA8643591.1 hypothetical protein ATNIH1004_010360 [Aspergillus tanneri]THC89282.1 hypothetical protein EYZ11_011276 [Aspergillus tanneri]